EIGLDTYSMYVKKTSGAIRADAEQADPRRAAALREARVRRRLRRGDRRGGAGDPRRPLPPLRRQGGPLSRRRRGADGRGPRPARPGVEGGAFAARGGGGRESRGSPCLARARPAA